MMMSTSGALSHGHASSTPSSSSSGLSFQCHIVLPDLHILVRVLEKSLCVGTTFGMYFASQELFIQSIMAQDQLGFDAAIDPAVFLRGSSLPHVYETFTTKQRTAAVLSFLKEHALSSPAETDVVGLGCAVVQPTASSHSAVHTTVEQMVMVSWLDHSGRIAIHVHPHDCKDHVHGQTVEDWSAHIIRAAQFVPDGCRTSPYVATFEPINDRYEKIVATRSFARVSRMPVALRFASSQELSNQARDAALVVFGPVIIQWKPERLLFFGVGASGVPLSEVNCFPHPTAKGPLDFIRQRPASCSSADASSSSKSPSADLAAALAAVTTSPAEDSSVTDDEPQVEYAACSLDTPLAHSMVSPTLLLITAKILATQANQPTQPCFLWLPGDTTQPVVFGGVMSGSASVRWFVHIEASQANSLEYCPSLVWEDRPDLKTDFASLMPTR